MFKHRPLRLGIDKLRVKLKSPNYARSLVGIGLWDMDVVSASKKPASTIGAKNIPIRLKLTRLIVTDIG